MTTDYAMKLFGYFNNNNGHKREYYVRHAKISVDME